MNWDEMTLEEAERYVNDQKEKRINLPGEEGLKWKKIYGIITEKEYDKRLAEIRKNKQKFKDCSKDWWHRPWYKNEGMYL